MAKHINAIREINQDTQARNGDPHRDHPGQEPIPLSEFLQPGIKYPEYHCVFDFPAVPNTKQVNWLRISF